MPFAGRIGDAVETRTEMSVDWKIENFSSLSEGEDDFYDSPIFSFADSRWHFRLYPNADAEEEDTPEPRVRVFFCQEKLRPCKPISCEFEFKCSDQEKRKGLEEGCAGFIWSVDLMSRADLEYNLGPSDVLTVTCHLKCSEPDVVKVSLSNRLWDVSRNMKTIMANGERSDFKLKLGGREWPVHKVVLESRSEYFANMFRHDWVENTEGEVTFKDIEEEALNNVLNFIYTGCVERMSMKNVCGIFIAAHKFLLDDLKALCIEYIKANMCVKTVCKIFAIALTYGEEDLRRSAIEYFNQEAENIFASGEWKEFKKTHSSVVAELLEESTKRERRKRRRIEIIEMTD